MCVCVCVCVCASVYVCIMYIGSKIPEIYVIEDVDKLTGELIYPKPTPGTL